MLGDTYFGIGDWHLQLGTIGEWVAGLGAAAAVVAAVVVPLRIFRHEREQRAADDAARAAEEERRRSHAVNAWLEVRVDRTLATFGDPGPRVMFAVVTNVGADVITDWRVEVGVTLGETGQRRHEWRWVMSNLLSGSLAPGQTIEAEFPTDGLASVGVAAVVFTDAFGARWRRQGNEVTRAEDAATVRAQSEAAALDHPDSTAPEPPGDPTG